jgi:NDP-sugar pyrophosphorylase family protein
MEPIIGIGLAGGSGVRIRPLTLKAPGYLRAKAAITLLGRRVIDWILDLLRMQGLDDYLIITKGKENRYQIKQIVGYGDDLGVRIRYSPVSLDNTNVGSADALLANLAFFEMDGTAVVFATDTVFDIDLPAMLAHHRATGAVATIAVATHPAEEIAGRYGLVRCAGDGAVLGFHEKPSLAEIRGLYGAGDDAPLPPLTTNSGFYIFDIAALRAIAGLDAIQERRRRAFDIGGDLLPWLVEHGYPVHTFALGRMGDLGNIPSYLETMLDVMHGRFTKLNPCLPGDCDGGGLMIDPATLALRDPHSRLTLAEKMARGLVTITPPVRIGRYVSIAPGVTIAESNIDDDCEILEEATILRSSLGPGSLIGPGSHMEDALLGFMVDLQSTLSAPVRLHSRVALGDEVVIRAGVTLPEGVVIHPRLKLPAGIHIPPNVDVETIAQLHEYL